MSTPLPELSSVATNLHELAVRIGQLASQARDNDLVVTELYEVERTLVNADRRLQKLLVAVNSDSR